MEDNSKKEMAYSGEAHEIMKNMGRRFNQVVAQKTLESAKRNGRRVATKPDVISALREVFINLGHTCIQYEKDDQLRAGAGEKRSA